MNEIKVLLADDQILFVESLKTVIEAITDDIKIVGTAHDGKEALELVKKTKPDVVLLDVRMPVMDGVETAIILQKKHPCVKVMMLTTFDDDRYVHDALEHGAMGYMLKDIPPEDLVSSIRAMIAGSVQISPHIFHKIMYPGSRGSEKISEEEIKRLLDRLSRREKEILELMAGGMDNREIAEKLFIAEQTVKNHISSIYSKLNIHDRTAVIRFAEKLLPYL